MNVAKIDKNNRIVIDKKTRTKLGLKAGDSIVIIPSGKEIRLIPIDKKKSFIGSLDGFEYDPINHKATELLFRKTNESSKK
ncbi:MAG: AbrB/MazE/SpoVT family DNA-binding domain-containing protein [Candidatus Hodarchaeales archaeon]|jgi:AbrB family looped-hinge helix DNA binding protein